jgi:hypothetical protein
MRAPLGKFRIAAAAAVILGSTAMLPNTAYAQYYHHGHGFGWGGFAAGAAAGALLGGLLAAPHYAPGPYGYYGGYPAPYGYYGGYSADAVRYCMQRFRSYDPGSGTYLGYDGYRHPCP